MPFDVVEVVRGYERNTRRVVATRRARPDEGTGYSVEFYRRDRVANRWEEALRVDALPGDVHVHLFVEGASVVEREISSVLVDATDLAAAVADYVIRECGRELKDAGFGPDLDDERRRDEVLEFLEGEIFETPAAAA